MCKGVLSEDICFEEESHFNGLLEYPHYTRPEIWQGEAVPSVLLSGHHKNIAEWRHQKSLEVTKERRPEMYERYMELNPPPPPKKKRRKRHSTENITEEQENNV